MLRLALALLVLFAESYALLHEAPLYRANRAQKSMGMGKYFIKLKDGRDVDALVTSLSQSHGPLRRGGGERVLNQHKDVIQGLEARLPLALMNVIRRRGDVEYVQEIGAVQLGQTPAPLWNIDRINQDALPLDGNYDIEGTGAGVTAYVIDTGINPTHQEFKGRAQIVFDSFNADGKDCNGHGTQAAGIIGGANFGVAKRVNLSSLKVFPSCSLETDEGSVVAAFNYLVTRIKQPAVVSTSIYVPGGSQYLDDVIRSFITKTNVTVVALAGNYNYNACTDSPGRVAEVLTVAATDEQDRRASFSNYGTCVNLYAPGEHILCATYTDGGYNYMTGTSAACPHVAGAVALLLEKSPDLTPRDTHERILQQATPGVVQDTKGGPNLLLRVNHSSPTAQ
ncbi:uncharacterized protein LOC110986654 [Acanthaster planci]|uniref:Uncharacterized protein LOC110986654 n=1 Tax=Acanthaster planci TaxID=133434 RepID=A0A8B7ZHA8_ACAPL|nr:uncharacterized protein LOC110986654 [Acanthaster planci]